MNPASLSQDMQRILQLPVKPDNSWGGWPVFDYLYLNGNADDNEIQLNQLQRVALSTLKTANGLLGLIPVGWGKTLIGLLAPSVLQSTKPIYLTKSKNVETVYEEWRKFKTTFHIHPNLKVYGYEGQLSRAEFATLLKDYGPDLIVADEAHLLAMLTAARTKRFVRYFQECEAAGIKLPTCICMSGTLTKRSIRDYEHLSRIALREGSPIPFDENELSSWASVLDAGVDALLGDFTQLQPLATFNWGTPVTQVLGPFNSTDLQTNYREAFRRRLCSSPGVVTTSEPSVDCSLSLNLWSDVQIPNVIEQELSKLDLDPFAYGLLPPTDLMGPQQYDDYITNFKMEKSNQLMHGFYYTLDWPGGVPDMDYINARSQWAKLLSIELAINSRNGYDSPALVAEAIDAGKVTDTALCDAWKLWKVERQKPEPPQKIVWVDDFMVNNVVKWLDRQPPGAIVWVAYDAFGQRLQEHSQYPYFGAGSGKPTALKCAASAAAHGTGHNLQYCQMGLVICPILSAAAWEQLLGRWHRQGQQADEVFCEILLHTDRYKRKWNAAIKEAEMIEQTTGQKQKILYATKIKERGPFM